MTRTWLGTHSLVIRGTNGQQDSSATARGDGGLFDSVDSSPILVTIIDPCINSVVNSDNAFSLPSTFKVASGQTKNQLRIDGPSNSISLVYGNGFDRCGPLKYVLVDSSGLPFVNSQFSLDVKPITDAADNVTLTLSSIPSGLDVTVYFKLEVSLKDYPLSTPVSLDV